jgi:ATP-dependent Clp protease ATP-binding subunit ClpC
VLFDEIEKAHPEVFNILLQILEDGYLSDAKGRKINFANTIIIMTSNIGAEKLQKEASVGFRALQGDDIKQLNQLHEENSSKVLDEMKKIMRPELINRIDKIVVFNALTKQIAAKILDLQLKELSERLNHRGLGVTVTASAKKVLLEDGYDAANGVRPLRRVVQDTIEDHIAEGLLQGDYQKGDVINVSAKKSKLKFERISG